MGRRVWQGELLDDLLTLKWKDFSKKYPDIKKNTYKGKRVYWKNKILEGAEPMPEGIENVEGRLYKTWEVSAFNRETNEWETTLNHAYEHGKEEFEYQAEPARITPSRAKAPKREHKVYFAYGDAQIDYRNIDGELIPIHDERAIDVALQLAKALRPELIVNLGDNVDLSNLSRFKKDSDHFFRTLAPSFQRAHDIYAQLRSDNPDAQIV